MLQGGDVNAIRTDGGAANRSLARSLAGGAWDNGVGAVSVEDVFDLSICGKKRCVWVKVLG
jgi:hypothetical protein